VACCLPRTRFIGLQQVRAPQRHGSGSRSGGAQPLGVSGTLGHVDKNHRHEQDGRKTLDPEEPGAGVDAGVTISGSGLGEAERIQAMQVTPSFFRVLQAQPYRGQVFTDAQGELGQEKVVVLTHGLWQRVFGGRDDAIGQDLRLGGEPYKIVGVMPPGFVFLNPDIQLFRPLALSRPTIGISW